MSCKQNLSGIKVLKKKQAQRKKEAAHTKEIFRVASLTPFEREKEEQAKIMVDVMKTMSNQCLNFRASNRGMAPENYEALYGRDY